MKYSKIGFFGLGLMGASMAKLIKSTYPKLQLWGLDLDEATVAYARQTAVFHQVVTQLSHWPTALDVVFVCTPISTVMESLQRVDAHLTSSAIITDIASVKAPFKDVNAGLHPKHVYIPGHPMAGKEVSGIQAADEAILKGAPYLVVPRSGPSYADFCTFIKELGFKLIEISEDDHDRAMAWVSHLPFLMACLTVNACGSESLGLLKSVLGPGFRDSTRVAGSSQQWALDICTYNKKNILEALAGVMDQLETVKTWIQCNQTADLALFFTQIATLRKDLLP